MVTLQKPSLNDFSLQLISPVIDRGTNSAIYDNFYKFFSVNIKKIFSGFPVLKELAGTLELMSI